MPSMRTRNLIPNQREIAGAVGDLGVFAPLVIALIALNGLHPTPVFLVAGLFYVGSALYYRLPMPVQPLKAVSAIALATGASASLLASAGLLMGIVFLAIAWSGLGERLQRFFSRPLVRGIQLGLGFLLVQNGFRLIQDSRLFPLGETWTLWGNLPVGLLLGGTAIVLLLALLPSRKLPASLVVLGLGLGIGILAAPSAMPRFAGETFSWLPVIPTGRELLEALLLLVIPQVPLTYGNSVAATAETARHYFQARAQKVTPRALCTSLGLANLAAGFLQGIPLCHGAGGLTAHYRFGARTGSATLLIGAGFLLLALLPPAQALGFLSLIPLPILGALLVYTGLEHAMLVADLMDDREGLFTALTVAAVALVTRNLFLGFAIGYGVQFALKRLQTFGVAPQPGEAVRKESGA